MRNNTQDLVSSVFPRAVLNLSRKVWGWCEAHHRLLFFTGSWIHHLTRLWFHASPQDTGVSGEGLQDTGKGANGLAQEQGRGESLTTGWELTSTSQANLPGTSALPNTSPPPSPVLRQNLRLECKSWTPRSAHGTSPGCRMDLAARRVVSQSTLLGCEIQIYELFSLNSDMDFWKRKGWMARRQQDV